MAGLTRYWPAIAAICLLGLAAGLTLVLLSGGDGAAPLVEAPSATPPGAELPTPAATLALRIHQSTQDGQLYAYAVVGSRPEDLIFIETLATPSPASGNLIVWWENGRARTQLFEVSGESAIIKGVQQRIGNQRELAVVYDAAAYGSGSPMAGVALLRLEGNSWRVLWDSRVDADAWRGGHGRVAFPDGDIGVLEVRGDIWGDGGDELPSVLFEANAGPHRQFVDRWERDGDGYIIASAQTVPSPYATLVEFLYALGNGDDARAERLVTDGALIDRARTLGLDEALGKGWLVDCADWSTCLDAGPIGFDPLRTRGEPAAEVFFEEDDGRWLIDDVREVEP